MRLRRLIGSFLTLFTLHLNLLGADFACAKHGSAEGGSATEHAMVMPGTASSHVHDAAPRVMETPVPSNEGVAVRGLADDQPPCDAPAQPSCCKALASCTIVFSSGTALAVVDYLNESELIAPHAMTSPRSERAAPEPPPPKA